MPPRTLAVVALALGWLLGACGDGGSEEAFPTDGCGPDTAERVDPGSAIHVLDGAPEPEYSTDPPTSGPHAPGPPLDGVVDEVLARPVQVGHLEAGGILLQHGQLTGDRETALEALAGDGVVVAPNDALPAPIVATAWTRKLQCGAIDAGALQEFVDDHLGNGPGTDG